MLTNLHLQNFRCFADHHIHLRPLTVVVGKNNAGKSTIVEALRLLSIVVSRYQSLVYHPVPRWLDIPRRFRGVSPSLENMGINFRTVFHRYGTPPAVTTASFDSGEQVTIHIGKEGEVFAVICGRDGQPISNKGQAQRVRVPPVSILPQVAPVAREEQVLSADYVRQSLSSTLAPLHFRNQLNLLPQHFRRFRELAEGSWQGLRIVELQGKGGMPSEPLSLLLRDGDFTSEIAWMGHGIQMWLQAMWFLSRVEAEHAVILDEPDVYMHADLQRRLVRLIRGLYQQVIIATHSVEIMAEVEPENILVVDRRNTESRFAGSLPAVQRVVDQMGGVHNVQLARLWNSQRYLMVEGKDVRLLKQIQNTLFPDSETPLDTIPANSIGGWGGWSYAVGSSMTLKNSVGQDIIVYCIFDSDYHTPTEIQERQSDAKERGVALHIWSRKEIENMLLAPSAICRIIASGCRRGVLPPSIADVERRLDEIAEELRDQVFDAMATEHLARAKAEGLGRANQAARSRMDVAWQTREGRLAVVSGKQVLSKLSEWAQREYGVSFTSVRLAKELRPMEIPSEMAMVVRSLEQGIRFK